MTAYPPLTDTDINALARMGLPRTSLDLPKENTTMAERIDHAEAAEQILEWFDPQNRPAEAAQAHATLALAEQQRITNLIALAQATHADVFAGLDALLSEEQLIAMRKEMGL